MSCVFVSLIELQQSENRSCSRKSHPVEVLSCNEDKLLEACLDKTWTYDIPLSTGNCTWYINMHQTYLYYIIDYQSVQFVLPLVRVCDASFSWKEGSCPLVGRGGFPDFEKS